MPRSVEKKSPAKRSGTKAKSNIKKRIRERVASGRKSNVKKRIRKRVKETVEKTRNRKKTVRNKKIEELQSLLDKVVDSEGKARKDVDISDSMLDDMTSRYLELFNDD